MNTLFGFLNLGGGEIILILALVLILFGAKRLPELAKGLGQGIKEFKKAARNATESLPLSPQSSINSDSSEGENLGPQSNQPARPADLQR